MCYFTVCIHLLIYATCYLEGVLLTTVWYISSSMVLSNYIFIKMFFTTMFPRGYKIIIIFRLLLICLAVRAGTCLRVMNLIL